MTYNFLSPFPHILLSNASACDINRRPVRCSPLWLCIALFLLTSLLDFSSYHR